MTIFEGFDFAALESPDFKEDSVREAIILPMLHAMGYKASGPLTIVRSRKLAQPHIRSGSQKKALNYFPDYVLEFNGKPFFVLDAKAPGENVIAGDNVHQVYSYAIHPEIRATYYGLCNGSLFTVFHVTDQFPITFEMQHIDERLGELARFLRPSPLQPPDAADLKLHFDYASAVPPTEVKNIRKQSAPRHYGVHGYFTKQAWEVVQAYINRFTKRGDLILDPFGGTGVTDIEAMVLGRHAIHIDLNPLSVFWVRTILQPVRPAELSAACRRTIDHFQASRPTTEDQVKHMLANSALPIDLPLPRGSDVPSVLSLFTRQQLAELACLKQAILTESDEAIRELLLLAFSGAVTKTNLTYHPSGDRSAGRGDSGVFRYYRYRVAPRPAPLDLAEVFTLRCRKIMSAKREIDSLVSADVLSHSAITKGDAADLAFISSETVDYIYTDPPYGKKIPYLDLSTMWNAWLDLEVTDEDYVQEAIEGGSRNKSKADYSGLITKSIGEMYRVLKWDRWMSFVFQHQDPRYWHLIVDTAEQVGFEYVGAISQANGQTSFKKRQHHFTVLSGQMVINFRKVRNPKSLLKGQLGMDVTAAIFNNIEALIAKNMGATLEEIYNELVIHGLELGYLDVLSREYSDLTPLLRENFDYNSETGQYQLPPNNKFKSRIPLHLRVRYFLMSMLTRKEREGTFATFDEIVYNIMPLLKNGVTPEDQDIRGVLEEVAEHQGSDRWRIKSTKTQQELF